MVRHPRSNQASGKGVDEWRIVAYGIELFELTPPDGRLSEGSQTTLQATVLMLDDLTRGSARQGVRAVLHDQDIGKGSGLGLSTLHGVVTQSGGSDSTVGEGTTERVYLRRAAGVAATDGPREPAAANRDGGNATIPVIDDDPDAREVAVNCLLSLGYRILEAETATRRSPCSSASAASTCCWSMWRCPA